VDMADSVRVPRVHLLGYCLVCTTPSPEAKLFCDFLLEKLILSVIALEDSWCCGIPASCSDPTFESKRSLRTSTTLCLFRGSPE